MKIATSRQTTGHLLLVRPARFAANPETAPSNSFQRCPDPGDEVATGRARQEFDALVAALRGVGAHPFVVEDTPEPVKPDAVFPNNWVSFHADGTMVLYPIQAANRRPERRRDLLEQLAAAGLVRLDRVLDLTALETRGHYLEGTGSLVLDRPRARAWAALSGRTHPDALAEFTRRTGIAVLAFHATDAVGRPVYHTNVMLAVGERFAVVCAEAVPDPAERATLLADLGASGRELIEISRDQMGEFAGNLLEVRGAGGQGHVVLSGRAARALVGEPLRRLATCAAPLVVPVPTIERLGGGSVRCMIAEIFPPPAEEAAAIG